MTDLHALTLTLWGEARGEPIDGLIGVAMVIRNRVLSHYRGAQSWREVCLAPKQFSCWDVEAAAMTTAEANLTSGRLTDDLRRCQEVAVATMAGTLADNTHGSNHYLTHELYTRAAPTWAKGGPIVTLGSQVFLSVA